MKAAVAGALALVAASWATPGLAQKTPDEEAKEVIAAHCALNPPSYELKSECGPTRFRRYEPNYVVYQWTQHDESSFRFHYSFRYLFFTPDCVGPYRRLDPSADRAQAVKEMRNCFATSGHGHELYMMYTGEFDFYWGTRPSGPVVNRISNPGFHYRKYTGLPSDAERGFKWFDFGLEHRSDGQTVDPKLEEMTPAGPVRVAQVAYDKSDYQYFDKVSRDTNYLTSETHLLVNRRLDLYARVKWLYFGNETEITWGPLADQNVKMRDYDRFRFIFKYTFRGRRLDRAEREQGHVSFEWTVGDKALQSDSANFGLYMPIHTTIGDLPFFARLHLGPMHTLSNFTQSQSSIGIGLMFLE